MCNLELNVGRIVIIFFPENGRVLFINQAKHPSLPSTYPFPILKLNSSKTQTITLVVGVGKQAAFWPQLNIFCTLKNISKDKTGFPSQFYKKIIITTVLQIPPSPHITLGNIFYTIGIVISICLPLRLLTHFWSRFLRRLSSVRSRFSGIIWSANLANRTSI